MSDFLSLLGWAFLPNFITSTLQSIYYGIAIRAGDPRPQPGSPRYNSHRRTIYILVVALYLLYTIYEADYEICHASSFYTDLSVPFTASDRDVKTRFRRLAAMHHPDKAGADSAAAAANYFIHLKMAAETLQDSAKRFAYERLGPETMRWQKAKTIRDFVTKAVLQSILPHYGLAAATIYVLGLFGYMQFGKSYRWLILLTLCTFEVHAVTRPHFPPILNAFNAAITRITAHPPYLPFQFIRLVRKLTITLYVALSQIGPHLASFWQNEQVVDEEGKALAQGLDRLEQIASQLDGDAGRLMEIEMAPFKGDREAMVNLQGKMKDWLIQNTIRADPMVRDALGTSLRKRRVDGPVRVKSSR